MPDVALVTGGNKGLGREICRQLAANGLTVLLGSRDRERGAHAAAGLGAGVRPVALDVTDPASVADAAEWVRTEYGALDVLVNNAGVIVEAPATALGTAQLREMFEVNVLGAHTAIQAFLPLLRAAAAPRIVNVSSTTASLTLTAQGTDFGGDAARRLGYSTSKTALNMLTVQYARAFAADPALAHLRINAATPGYIATEMNGHRGTRTVAEGAAVVVALACGTGRVTGTFRNDAGTVPW